MKMSTSIQESKSSTWSSTWSFPLPQLGSASGWKPAAEKGKWLLALVLGGTWLLCFSTCQLISDLYTVRVDKMKENIFNHNLLSLSGLGRYLILLCVCVGGVFVHLGWEFHLWRPFSWKSLGPTTCISTLTCCANDYYMRPFLNL